MRGAAFRLGQDIVTHRINSSIGAIGFDQRLGVAGRVGRIDKVLRNHSRGRPDRDALFHPVAIHIVLVLRYEIIFPGARYRYLLQAALEVVIVNHCFHSGCILHGGFGLYGAVIVIRIGNGLAALAPAIKDFLFSSGRVGSLNG